jgi:NAD(P) transhydrogenase
VRLFQVEKAETDVVMDQLMRERVEIISGTARFMEGAAPNGSPRCMILKTVGRKEAESSIYRHLDADRSKMIISAEKYLIACGTRPLRPSHIPFDGKTIFDSDQILWGGVKNVPRDLIVVGAGVIGMEVWRMGMHTLPVKAAAHHRYPLPRSTPA